MSDILQLGVADYGYPVLAASIIVHGAFTKNVYDGGKPALIESFADELPDVSLEYFQHLTSIVGHVSFPFPCRNAVWHALTSKHKHGLLPAPQIALR